MTEPPARGRFPGRRHPCSRLSEQMLLDNLPELHPGRGTGAHRRLTGCGNEEQGGHRAYAEYPGEFAFLVDIHTVRPAPQAPVLEPCRGRTRLRRNPLSPACSLRISMCADSSRNHILSQEILSCQVLSFPYSSPFIIYCRKGFPLSCPSAAAGCRRTSRSTSCPCLPRPYGSLRLRTSLR